MQLVANVITQLKVGIRDTKGRNTIYGFFVEKKIGEAAEFILPGGGRMEVYGLSEKARKLLTLGALYAFLFQDTSLSEIKEKTASRNNSFTDELIVSIRNVATKEDLPGVGLVWLLD